MNNEAFYKYIDEFQSSLRELLLENETVETTNHIQGLSRELVNKILVMNPLSVFIPAKYGGLGDIPHQCLSLLEAATYESIAVGLMFGINGALFLEPVSKYGTETAKKRVFKRFLEEKALGGLMITEPDFGTDAFSMRTCYQKSESGYQIQGKKHWGGLTGLADFWLVTARKQKPNQTLSRDVDLFICEMTRPGERIVVEEYYHKLGLFLIPYGLNLIDVSVPEDARLVPISSGLKLMMDLLHRSRLRLSGIGLGFTKRMMDEAIEHCQKRIVGGKALAAYDQVQARLVQLQAWFTITSAICAYASRVSDVKTDLSGYGFQANSFKAIVTDMMQDSAQSLVQLIGGKAFRRDHIAGRGIVDSRPFQIFEGSNDVMYSQVADMIVKEMKRVKQTNLFKFYSGFQPTNRATGPFKEVLDIKFDPQSPQRTKVKLGKIAAWLAAADLLQDLESSGFRKDLISNAHEIVKETVKEIATGLKGAAAVEVVSDYQDGGDWKMLNPTV